MVLFVNTVASSDVPPIISACKQAGAYCTIWWNKPDDYEPWDQGDNFVAFQKHGGVDSGRCTASTLAESIGKGGIIALGGVQDSTTSQTRVAGLQDELKKYPDAELLEVRPANWDPQLAFQETQNMIAKYGDKIKGIWAADDGMIIGAKEAVDKSDLAGKVKFSSDGLYPPVIDIMQKPNNPIVGETFHRGYMASAIGLYTAYLAATGEIDPSELPEGEAQQPLRDQLRHPREPRRVHQVRRGHRRLDRHPDRERPLGHRARAARRRRPRGPAGQLTPTPSGRESPRPATGRPRQPAPEPAIRPRWKP